MTKEFAMKQHRKALFQNIGTLVALVISIIAMITSIYEANILKSQQKSMVWPYLSVGTNFSDSGFSATVYNNGTGPAIVKSVEVRVGSKPVGTIFELLEAIKPGHSLGYDVLRQNKVNNYVFRPGEEVEIIGFPWNDENREIAGLIYKKVRILICYESVLGESWIYDSKNDTHKEGSFTAKIPYKN